MMELKHVRRLWFPTASTCMDCGDELPHLPKSSVYGWGVQCHGCMLERLEAPPTGERTDPHSYKTGLA
jgi:hypothetical protein